MAAKPAERGGVKKKKGGNGLQKTVKGKDEWWFGELTSRRGELKTAATEVTSPTAYWITHNAMMGSITGHTGTENQHRPMAPNGCIWLWLLQESDLGGLLCGKSVHIIAVCITKDPYHPRGHHASQSFNGVNGPSSRSVHIRVEGELQRPSRVLLQAAS